MNSDLTTEERYSPEIAEARYRENLAAKGGELKIGSDHELAAFIEKKIGEEGYSPAAVVGEIKRLGLTFKTEISEKTIYNYIDKGIFYGIGFSLWYVFVSDRVERILWGRDKDRDSNNLYTDCFIQTVPVNTDSHSL